MCHEPVGGSAGTELNFVCFSGCKGDLNLSVIYLLAPKVVLQTVEEFQSQAQQLLSDWKRDSPPEQLEIMLEEGAKLPAVVPECDLLRGLKEQGHWLTEVRRALGSEGGERQEVTLDVLRNLMEAGCNVPQSVSVETAMAELQELLTIAERWEEKAQICLEQRSVQWNFLCNSPPPITCPVGTVPNVSHCVSVPPGKSILFPPWMR